MKVFKSKQVSKKFLVAASAYRRMARDRAVDFSLDSLVDQYGYESRGGKSPDPSVNGYTCGKWILDATLKQMREDHQDGLMTKHDLSQGSCAFVRRVVKSFNPATYFANRKSNE